MNNKDDKEKKPIKIDIENLEDMSEEDIVKLINELTSNEQNGVKPSFGARFKNLLSSFIIRFIIGFILVFTINSFVKVIDTSFINLVIYFLIFHFVDFVFNKYVMNKFPLITMISFGLINFVITLCSFIISGIVCLQFMEIVFSNFITYFIAIIVFVLIKKFVLKYLIKLRKKGNNNVSSK